jgi:hypothetical protein
VLVRRGILRVEADESFNKDIIHDWFLGNRTSMSCASGRCGVAVGVP